MKIDNFWGRVSVSVSVMLMLHANALAASGPDSSSDTDGRLVPSIIPSMRQLLENITNDYNFCEDSWEELFSHYNTTKVKPLPLEFCAAKCGDSVVQMLDAVGSSYKLHNVWQTGRNMSTCALDFTDYSVYSSLGFFPAVNPCANGGFLPYLVLLLYCFLGLMVVCDEYFVPALEVMVDVLGLDDDVAGATLMAAGGSAPELFTSIMGTFLSESSVGFGTIIGSAVFNVLFIIGCCAIFAKDVLQLTWWPLARDCTCYIVALCYLYLCFAVFSPYEIEYWEALSLFALYMCYVLIMKYNRKLHCFILNRLRSRGKHHGSSTQAVSPAALANVSISTANSSHDNSIQQHVGGAAGGASAFTRPTRFRAGILHLMYSDGLMDNARVHIVSKIKGDVRETFRALDTDGSGFIDKTELGVILSQLTMAKVTAEDVQKALDSIDTNHDNKISLEEFTSWYIKSESRVLADMTRHFNMIDTSGDGQIDRSEVRAVLLRISEDQNCDEADIDAVFREADFNGDFKISFAEFRAWYQSSMLWKNALDKTAGDDVNEEPVKIEWPRNRFDAVIFVITAPVTLALYFTIPDVRGPTGLYKYFGLSDYKTLWPLTWSLAITWIAIFSFFMVWSTSLLGDLIGVPPAIMGLTFLAAGTSIPDLVTSIIVARQGLGDMAVSSSIGSNIFDILIGLPVPWLLFTLTPTGEHPTSTRNVTVTGDGMGLSLLILIAMIAVVVSTIAACKWKMTKNLGIAMFVLYVIFLLEELFRQSQLGEGC